MEEWRDIKGFVGAYQISNFGRVKNVRTGRILKPGMSNRYDFVALWVDNKQHGKKIHNLVADAFLEPRPEWADGVNHIDGNRANNHAINLEWATHKQNMAHATRLKLRSRPRREYIKRGRPFYPLIHGRASTYSNRGCRCELCLQAVREYNGSRRALKRL